MALKQLILGFLAVALPLAAYPADSARESLTGNLLITGSSTMAGMIDELAKRFIKQHPGVVIAVEAGGTGRGIKDAASGKADIGMASRALKAEEKQLFALTIARDGVALAVHQSNPITGLTKAQAFDVFTGKITNWKTLGGPDARIEVLTRKPGHATLELMSQYFGIAPEAIKAAQSVGDNAEAVQIISGNRNAIGFLSTGIVDDAKQKGATLKPLKLDGAMAGIGSIRDGSWPLARPLNLLTRTVPTGLAKAFIEYVLSPAAYPVIREFDYVPFGE